MITLENEHLIVSIDAKGAELQSLTHKQTGLNYLYDGSPEFWAKRSPVLFPIVGGLKNETYIYKNESYTMGRHGFARDCVFIESKNNDSSAQYVLTYSEETLKIYPFKFELTILYELIEHKLVVNYKVKNIGQEVMYFSLGAHPAFAVPLTPNTKFTDYYLTFNDDLRLDHYNLNNGLLDHNYETIALEGKKLPLKPELFYKDALVLKSLQSNCISLLNIKTDNGLHFHFENFPYFGIWSAKDAPFVCLEPWCGVTDLFTHNQQLELKEGIEKLLPNDQFDRYWEVECF